MRAIRAVPLPLLLAACAAGDAAERTLVRDSAGITIVETDRILAVEPDDLDVERVVVYRLNRTDGS